MALLKTSFTQFKTLAKLHPLLCLSLRLLTFATPEEAAAHRRHRKRLLGMIQPSLNSLRQSQPQNPNPNVPKLPDHVSVLKGSRLNLHNRILTLILQNDLEEASLLTRHSIYSNCKPTIFTCNSVLAALLRQSRYCDLLSLHRFITQAGVIANIVTHNLVINAYCDSRRTDTALEHYKQLIKNAPFNPSPTTYRILVKGLVDNSRVDRALQLKDEMLEKGFAADPIVYNYLMIGLVKKADPDGVFALYKELKGKLGFVYDGVVYGSLMKGYFQKGMEKEAMECFVEAVGDNSKVRMSVVAYNSVLDALSKNGKFDDAMGLFNRMKNEHNPPRRLTVNLETFNVMIDGYCAQGRFKDAIGVFRKMGEMKCEPDTLSVNNLIQQLCGNGMVDGAEELYREMGDKGVNPDEFTYILLMEACFAENRADEAAVYFGKMVESGLRPNLGDFNKVINRFAKAGKIDEAKGLFDQMVEKLKPEVADYEVMLRALCEAGKIDDVLKMVGDILKDENLGLNSEMNEIVTKALRKEGREEEFIRMLEEKEREKAEAMAKVAEAKVVNANALIAGSLEFLTKVAEAEAANVNSPAGNEEGTGAALADVGVVEASKDDDVAGEG